MKAASIRYLIRLLQSILAETDIDKIHLYAFLALKELVPDLPYRGYDEWKEAFEQEVERRKEDLRR